jgi:hypothetical protein
MMIKTKSEEEITSCPTIWRRHVEYPSVVDPTMTWSRRGSVSMWTSEVFFRARKQINNKKMIIVGRERNENGKEREI